MGIWGPEYPPTSLQTNNPPSITPQSCLRLRVAMVARALDEEGNYIGFEEGYIPSPNSLTRPPKVLMILFMCVRSPRPLICSNIIKCFGWFLETRSTTNSVCNGMGASIEREWPLPWIFYYECWVDYRSLLVRTICVVYLFNCNELKVVAKVGNVMSAPTPGADRYGRERERERDA